MEENKYSSSVYIECNETVVDDFNGLIDFSATITNITKTNNDGTNIRNNQLISQSVDIVCRSMFHVALQKGSK